MNNDIVTNLIRRLQAGDDRHLRALMEHYTPRVWPLILAESRNYEDAKEILQDTWQAVWENISGLRDVSSFGGWLRQIAYNQCRRYYNNAYHSQGERPYEDEVLTYHADRNAFMRLRESELKAELVEAVRHLPSKPEHVREVAILFYLDQMTLKEIAEELDLPLGTVKRKLHEARELLRKEFGVESE
ncbi:sigma-70 family RNA polymerase sigma factor [Candidatus Poribacteria bacterium]|nr:sigma-70 family RNA polymerase sigma factor [Candidatus Poribacteria bacterium]